MISCRGVDSGRLGAARSRFEETASRKKAMRGRYPSGPEYVEGLQGSAEAKRRAKIILETVTGQLRVQEACQALEVSEQRSP
jgi:hypothetical protein